MTPMEQQKLLRQARDHFSAAMDVERENRVEALSDLQFLAPRPGAGHWPEAVEQERTAAKRLMLTVNKLPQFVAQVANDMRINRAAIKVAPVDDNSDPKLAEVIAGLIRNIERNSEAVHVYAGAGTQAAQCGMGHWRIAREYVDDDSFDQDIRLRAIRNPFAVLWDSGAVEYTREDARHCFVYSDMPEDEFKETYPNASLSDFESFDPGTARDWFSGRKVRVAEYWVKRPKTEVLCQLQSGEVVRESTLKTLGATLPVVAKRTVQSHEIVMYLITGSEVLEGPVVWPGRYIPIISVWGREVQVGEVTVRKSVIRDAKDPQQLYNYWRTAGAEMIALAPKAPFMVTPHQIKGYEQRWARANADNKPFLPYNPDPAAPPPQRQPAPDVPVAMFQEAQFAEQDLHGTTGIYPPALGAKSNESSGKAILARQREADVGTFDFIDNLARSVAYCGRQLLDLIPRVYDGTRMVRILGDEEDVQFVTLNAPQPNEAGGVDYVTVIKDEDGLVHILPDLSAGKYDITVSTGPAFSTRREEARESMMAFAQTVPDAAMAVGDLIAKAQDWPGSEEIAKRLRRMAVQRGVADPAPEDQAQQPPQDPRAGMEAAKMQAEIDGKQLDNARKEVELSQMTGMIGEIVQQQVMQTLMQLLGPPPDMAGAMPQAQPGPAMEPGFL